MCEIQWKGGIQEISKKKYYEMLNCIPPREPYHLIDGFTHQFLMGEPYTHINLNDKIRPLYAQFGRKGNKYFYLGLEEKNVVNHFLLLNQSKRIGTQGDN